MRERSTNFVLQTVWHRADAIADGNREQPLKIENGTLLKPTHECRRFAAQDDATCGKSAFARVWRAVISIGIGGWIVPMRVQLRRDRGGRRAARQMGWNIRLVSLHNAYTRHPKKLTLAGVTPAEPKPRKR